MKRRLFCCPVPDGLSRTLQKLSQKLVEEGHECLSVINSTLNEIAKQIGKADAVVFLLTKACLTDPLFKKILLYSMTSLKKTVLVFALQDFQQTKELLTMNEVGIVLSDSFLIFLKEDLSDWETRDVRGLLSRKLGITKNGKINSTILFTPGRGTFVSVFCSKNTNNRKDEERIGAIDPFEITQNMKQAGYTQYEIKMVGFTKEESPIFQCPVVDVALVFVSNDFAADTSCVTQLQAVLEVCPRVIPLVVGEGWSWVSSTVGLELAGELYIDLQQGHRFKEKMLEFDARVTRLVANAHLIQDQKKIKETLEDIVIFIDQAWIDGRKEAVRLQNLFLNTNSPTTIIINPEKTKNLRVLLDTDTIKHSIYEELSHLLRDTVDVFVPVISPAFFQRPKPMGTLKYVINNLHKPVVAVLLPTVTQDMMVSSGLSKLLEGKVIRPVPINDSDILNLRQTILEQIEPKQLISLPPNVGNLLHKTSCDERPIRVMVSYCWSNSLDAFKRGDVPHHSGNLDPRLVARNLQFVGIKTWLDIEQLGTAGLFADLKKAVDEADVVVCCVSDEYSASKKLYIRTSSGPSLWYNWQASCSRCSWFWFPAVASRQDWSNAEPIP
eukprot:Lithocolla_globosa_v1_NODE_2303_length_2059_cov_5.739521.p1 type:complete len:610 gc:universal NODE_2303_length_2059_cov_5.739521:1884-55(-)